MLRRRLGFFSRRFPLSPVLSLTITLAFHLSPSLYNTGVSLLTVFLSLTSLAPLLYSLFTLEHHVNNFALRVYSHTR